MKQTPDNYIFSVGFMLLASYCSDAKIHCKQHDYVYCYREGMPNYFHLLVLFSFSTSIFQQVENLVNVFV